jgi:hypothetical protein
MWGKSVWWAIVIAVFVLFKVMLHLHTSYAPPPDSTPLHVVAGPIAKVDTTWTNHRNVGSSGPYGRSWSLPSITITLASGQSIRFIAHSEIDLPATQSLLRLRDDSTVRAQVDASGETWQLSNNGVELLAWSDTVSRHHQERDERAHTTGSLLMFGFLCCIAVARLGRPWRGH